VFLLNFVEICMERTFCIVGIGNTIRWDDGIGPYLCDKLAALPLRQTVFKIAHQLSMDWLSELSGFDDVLLIDACHLHYPFYFGPLVSPT
jgi:hydrogenase maturation protease